MNIVTAQQDLLERLEQSVTTQKHAELLKAMLKIYLNGEYLDESTFSTYAFTDMYKPFEFIDVEGSYVGNFDVHDESLFIKDLETLKKALAGGYSKSDKLVENAQAFLDMQEKYRVNAVFAGAVAFWETSGGTAANAIDCKNWFNITTSEPPYKTTYNPSTGNTYNWKIYPSDEAGIMGFGEFIANPHSTHYFAVGNYTVRTIGTSGYCEDADDENGWVQLVLGTMAEMYNAAGIVPKTSGTSQKGEKIVEAAREKLGCPYVWGAAGPDTFDCSGLTMWCYKQVGIKLTHYTETQKSSAKKVVSVSKARVGDILYTSGHVGIYIGNNKYIHAPTTGDVVKISNNANTAFSCALQYY